MQPAKNVRFANHEKEGCYAAEQDRTCSYPATVWDGRVRGDEYYRSPSFHQLSDQAGHCSPPLDPALEQAVSAAIRTQQPNAATDHIIVSPISRVKAWVFGSAAVIPQPSSDGVTDEETAPQILLFFAEQRGGGWQVALEHSPAFAQALTQIPQHLLTPEQWATMPTAAQLSGDGSMQLNLPWAIGETWNLTGGPHKTFRNETTRSGLDFAVNGGRVRAAREGIAYTPCGQNSDLEQIDHPGGFRTNYYHLAGIAVTNESRVERYTYIGMIGTGTRCLGGYVTGAHILFWVSRGGTPISIDGIDIGGWTVSALPGDYNGCMTRIRDGYRQCAVGRITNEGNFPPNPPYLISPEGGVTIKTPTVTLQVADAGDPDNWPAPTSNFRFTITKSDNSWSASSDWSDNTSWTVTLPSEGSYSWIVYAGDWELPSAAAGPRTLTYVPNRPPNPPNLHSPAHTATINTATVTLQVTDSGDPDNWPNSTRRFRSIITLSDNSWQADSGWINSPSWTVQLPRRGVYVWQTQANDGAANSALSGQRRLYYTIAASVPAPQPPTPAPNVWPVPYYSQLDSRWSTQPNQPACLCDVP
ncbi:M23 family metallopeptidase [Chloroflexus sp.]|uniref:M23 family metallopeptidase n=1 Tax=Chloroflexus sp. TaxID=1904827 RepID=UPI002ACEB716|nr:M23 family metallopeptidase [Chloroflexus sp.]